MGTFTTMLQRALGIIGGDERETDRAPQIEHVSVAALELLQRSGVSAALDALPSAWKFIARRTDRPVGVAVHIAQLALGEVSLDLIADPMIRAIVQAARASRLYRSGRPPYQESDFAPAPPTTAADVAAAYVGASELNKDQVETLVDLAHAGQEQEFREMAAMVGVRKDRIDGMWEGTRRRALIERRKKGLV